MTEEEKLLSYALERGIIDLTSIQKHYEMEFTKKVLELHNHKIWQGKDKKWRTYVLEFGKERRLIVKNSRQDLEDFLMEYYKVQLNEPYLEEVFEEWIDCKLKYHEIKKGSYDRYKTDFDRFFINNPNAEAVLRKRISKINERDLTIFIKSTIADMDLTRKTYSNLATIINGVFQHAKEQGYTKFSIGSYMLDLNLPKRLFKRQDKSKKKVFDSNEVDLLINYFLDEDKSLTGYGILFGYYTGLRPGELSVIKWSDIQDDLLHVHRMEERSKNSDGEYSHDIVDTTKTEAGDRCVALPKEAQDLLKLIRIKNPFNEFVFFNGKKVLTQQAFTNKLYRTCDKLKIERRSMNKMRKTYATKLINAEVDKAVIQRVMGHEDIKTTMSYYYFNDKSDAEIKRQILSVNF